MIYPALLLPAAMLGWAYLRFIRRKTIWRTLAVVFMIVLAGYPMPSRRSTELTLVVLADRSRSIDDEARQREEELLRLAEENLTGGDELRVVSFNREAHFEAALGPGEAFDGFQTPYDADASNLADGLRLALELTRPTTGNAILVLSDGEYTGLDPIGAASLASQRGVPVHHRLLGRRSFFDLGIADARGPLKIVAREPFTLEFDVRASEATEGEYRVLRDDAPMVAGGADEWRRVSFARGTNTLRVADFLAIPGTHRYTVEVRAADGHVEQLRENNRGDHYIRALGEDRVLVVNPTGAPDNVTRLLSAAGIPVALTSIDSYRYELVFLQGYKAIVLNDVSIARLTFTQIDGLARFVTEEGGGLLVTGGSHSFQAGGYYHSAVEDVLPVSMEIQDKTRRVATAMSFVLDRSGSMAVAVSAGVQKMDLANSGTVAGISMLTENDSVSVLAVDSFAHAIVPQSPLTNASGIMRKVKSIESMGGGIFVYTGLVAAGNELLKASQLNKHIVLFSDAADSEEPGDYINLLADYRAAGITVSVIGLGTDRDSDAQFLRDVAARGGGEIYFSDNPHQLPQLFTLDTMRQTRRTFIAEPPAAWSILKSADVITANNAWTDFSAADYNLVYTRDKADSAIVSEDDAGTVPGLAFWQRGAGRAAAIAFDTQGSVAREPFFGEMIVDTVRWIMGAQVADDFQVAARREGGVGRVELELADEEVARFERAVLRLYPPEGPMVERPLRWKSRNVLDIDFPIERLGAYRGMVVLNDKLIRMDPVALPASPEFLEDYPPDFGRQALRQISDITGGREILDLRDLFDQRTVVYRRRPFIYPLVLVVLICLVLDVAEERFAWAARAWAALRRRWIAAGWKAAAAGAMQTLKTATNPGSERSGAKRERIKTKRAAPTTGAAATAASAGKTDESSRSASAEPAETPPAAEGLSYLKKAKLRDRGGPRR